jgi:hypothetical protein
MGPARGRRRWAALPAAAVAAAATALLLLLPGGTSAQAVQAATDKSFPVPEINSGVSFF